MSHDVTHLQAVQLLYLHICIYAAAAQCLLDKAEGVCCVTNNTGDDPNSKPASFQYWIDFHTYLHYDDARAFDESLAALGGQRVGPGPLSKEEFESELTQQTSEFEAPSKSGSQNMGDWGIYVTASPKKSTHASKRLKPGQLVNMVPGTSAVTDKKKLVRTLRACYGQDNADELLPRTFLLPQERWKWQEWVQTNPEQDTRFWLLKTDQHRAEGLSLVPTSEALAASFGRPPKGRKWTMIQQYIANPLLLGGRKFSVRQLVLIPPGLDPFRVYIQKKGVLLFADEEYKPASGMAASPAEASQEVPTGFPAGHLTNLAAQRNLDGSNLKELAIIRPVVGEDVWKVLWDSMTNSTARIMAAALTDIRAKNSKMPARSAYELFGIDFLIDGNMHVWVTEVNAGPSLSMDAGDPAATARGELIMKAIIKDMYSMMRLQDRKRDQVPVLDFSEIEAELQLKGSWLPLMHLFPQHAASTTEPSGVPGIPWSEADLQLQAWMKDSPAYREAIADWYP